LKNCAGCGAPPRYDHYVCAYCARPNETHPLIAQYVDPALLRAPRRYCPPMRTSMPAPRAALGWLAFSIYAWILVVEPTWRWWAR
jgi:hypothetical protein